MKQIGTSTDFPYASEQISVPAKDGSSRLSYHYIDEGRGGVPVVMVHGNPTWSYYFRRLIAELSPTRRVIVPDHIGCGRSEVASEADYDYRLASRVRDLGLLIDELGLERVDLIVHDWGGMIGSAWAARNPQRVRRLVVTNTGAFHLPSSARFPPALAFGRAPYLGPLLIRGLDLFTWCAIYLCVARRKLPREVARMLRAPYRGWHNRLAVARFVQDIPLAPGDPSYEFVSETADRLESLRDKPMLLAWGMRDFVFDHHFLAEWQHRFPQARVQTFADCGHYLFEDAPEGTAALISEFLDDDSTRTRADSSGSSAESSAARNPRHA